MTNTITWTVTAHDVYKPATSADVKHTLELIEKIRNAIDAQRSELEDLEMNFREINAYHDDIDFDGEVVQAAAELEQVVDNLEAVLKGLKDPKTEFLS